MFVKTYPVYAQLKSDMSVGELLRGLDEQIGENRRNGLFAFGDFCAEFGLRPQVLFSYQGDTLAARELCGGLTAVRQEMPKDAKSEFEVTLWRQNGRFSVHSIYAMDLYDDAVIEAMFESYDRILQEMCSAEKLSEIDMHP